MPQFQTCAEGPRFTIACILPRGFVNDLVINEKYGLCCVRGGILRWRILADPLGNRLIEGLPGSFVVTVFPFQSASNLWAILFDSADKTDPDRTDGPSDRFTAKKTPVALVQRLIPSHLSVIGPNALRASQRAQHLGR